MNDSLAPGSGGRRVVAVVPARDGSKGLPGKNVRPLRGRPLYRHAVDVAIDAGLDRVVITTDIASILEQDDLPGGVAVHRRPTELCGDEVAMAPVLADLLGTAHFDDDPIVVLLQATTPMRTADHVRSGIERFRNGADELVMSVTPTDSGVLKYGLVQEGRFVPLMSASHTFANRQQLPAVYRPNGAIYVFGADWYRARGHLATSSIGVFVMGVEDSIDIDTLNDFERAEEILGERERNTDANQRS